jgi:hypothetical protein
VEAHPAPKIESIELSRCYQGHGVTYRRLDTKVLQGVALRTVPTPQAREECGTDATCVGFNVDNTWLPKVLWEPHACAGILCLDGPYTAAEHLAVTVEGLSSFIRVEMKIKTGADSMGDSDNALLMLGGSTAAGGCGNLFFTVSDGKIGFGVQCNGGGSDGVLEYTGEDTGQPNTQYFLVFVYDVETKQASIYQDGALKLSDTKTFNFPSSGMVSVNVGSHADENNPFQGQVSHIVVSTVQRRATLIRSGGAKASDIAEPHEGTTWLKEPLLAASHSAQPYSSIEVPSSVLDLTTITNGAVGTLSGGFIDGRYAYALPNSYAARVVRFPMPRRYTEHDGCDGHFLESFEAVTEKECKDHCTMRGTRCTAAVHGPTATDEGTVGPCVLQWGELNLNTNPTGAGTTCFVAADAAVHKAEACCMVGSPKACKGGSYVGKMSAPACEAACLDDPAACRRAHLEKLEYCTNEASAEGETCKAIGQDALVLKCNQTTWVGNKTCQQSCFDAGVGYDATDCSIPQAGECYVSRGCAAREEMDTASGMLSWARVCDNRCV